MLLSLFPRLSPPPPGALSLEKKNYNLPEPLPIEKSGKHPWKPPNTARLEEMGGEKQNRKAGGGESLVLPLDKWGALLRREGGGGLAKAPSPCSSNEEGGPAAAQQVQGWGC